MGIGPYKKSRRYKKSHSERSGISLYVSDKVTNRAVPNGVSIIAGVCYALSAATRRLAKDRQQETLLAQFSCHVMAL